LWLSDENKQLSDENKQLSDENKQLSAKNKQLSAKNKQLLNKNNALLKNDETVKNREIQLNQEVADRVEQELAKLSEEISSKKATIKELNEEIFLLLPTRSQINSERMDLMSKEKNLQLQAVRMESQIAILQREFEHQSQDKQNKHVLEVLQKMNDQFRLFGETFQASHDKNMEVVQSAIGFATQIAESKNEIHNHYIDNRSEVINNKLLSFRHSTFTNQHSNSKSLRYSSNRHSYSKSSIKNKMKAITN